MLDCVGDEPQEDVSVVVENRLIKDIFSGEKKLSGEVQVLDLAGRTILPGLIDAHAHPAVPYLDFQRVFIEPPILTAIKIKQGMEKTLQAGFTTVAEMGCGNHALKQAVAKGYIQGPRLLLACSMMSKTGGHADFCVRGDSALSPMKDTGLVSLPRLADGVEDCLRAVREQFRAGADHIKIMGTGGGASPNDTPQDSGFNEAELRAIMDECRDMGRRVAAHCINDDGIRRVVKCGITSVDHGMFMTEKSAEMMVAAGTYLVPTITILYMLKKFGREWGMADHLDRKTTEYDLLGEQIKCTELAYRKGVKIASASDAWAQVCGMEGWEIKLKSECGMTPMEAIKSATMVNAELIGLKDKLGSIEPGKYADLIVVKGSPEADPSIFCDPNNVRLVMKEGRIFKSTL
jgi:imidazolonepropionase-like amidohydrolase